MEGKARLSKVMAQRDMCSRREADLLIEKGFVLVNGQTAQLGDKVFFEDVIEVLPEGLRLLSQKQTVILNKPVGYTSHLSDRGYKTAQSLIIKQNQWRGDSQKWKPLKRTELAPAGRLDIDSKGLLILTQNGVLARRIIDSRYGIEKEYLVWFKGELNSEKIKKMELGQLKLNGQFLKPVKVFVCEKQMVRLILVEGKKRQIRRMFKLLGLRVVSLKRIRVGPIVLGSLKEGQWRYLTPKEEAQLIKAMPRKGIKENI
ncbi:MAG: rRNA pseudouridine synthase [Bdellovibrio sp.]|nr:MAG: rRNA pseudouridine synthase [Bdellovibrio sp.]